MTYARMATLRTVKDARPVPIMNCPSHVSSLIYEAQFGASAWEQVVRVPREAWMDYLRWFRHVLKLPVQNDTTVLDIGPEDGLICLGVELWWAP